MNNQNEIEPIINHNSDDIDWPYCALITFYPEFNPDTYIVAFNKVYNFK